MCSIINITYKIKPMAERPYCFVSCYLHTIDKLSLVIYSSFQPLRRFNVLRAELKYRLSDDNFMQRPESLVSKYINSRTFKLQIPVDKQSVYNIKCV
jgi:hypothetical protein